MSRFSKRLYEIKQKSRLQVIELAQMLVGINWLPNQRTYLKVASIMAESAPREDMILAVMQNEGLSDIEAKAVCDKLREVLYVEDGPY